MPLYNPPTPASIGAVPISRQLIAGANVTIDAGASADLDADVTIAASGGGGAVASVVAGSNVSVDDTDPANPIVNVPNIGVVDSVVAGAGIAVDNTDPNNPIITATGGGAGFSDIFECSIPAGQQDISGTGIKTVILWSTVVAASSWASLNAGTGEITISAAGTYIIMPTVLITDPSGAADYMRLIINRNGAIYRLVSLFAANELFMSDNFAAAIELAANDVITISVEVGGMAGNTADLLGNADQTFAQIARLF